MIQVQTIIKTADNSGVRYVRCIKVLGGSKKKWAKIGDLVIVSVIDTITKSKLKIGEVIKAIVVRTKKKISRKNGLYVKFNKNSVVIIDNKNEPMCTRIFGPIPIEIKIKNPKVFSLVSEIV